MSSTKYTYGHPAEVCAGELIEVDTGAGITKSGSAVADDCEQAESLLDDGEQSVSVDEFRAATLSGAKCLGLFSRPRPRVAR